MLQPNAPGAAPLTRMADGTIRQVSPFTGTEVWTVPGRANRPLGVAPANPTPLRADDDGAHCAFCERRYLETPPEKARLVARNADADVDEHERGPIDDVVEGDSFELRRWLGADEISASVAEFRRIPNLFEILSFDYWRANYGYELPEALAKVRDTYISTAAGAEHVERLAQVRRKAAGFPDDGDPEAEHGAATRDSATREAATAFFGSGHDVIVARRHFVDGATDDSQLASSGTLSVDEHRRYIAFSVEAMRALYEANRYVRYVAAFQNWLRPAGASFDHLHKQLVAIDQRGVQAELELQRLRANPNLFNEAAVNYAAYQNLIIAENEHAVAFAGFGHRFPTLEIFSTSPASEPWRHSGEEIEAMSDLLHACHAATGAQVPCNEEWHHRPIDVDLPMPWRIMLKWRVSTLAGFEGGTKIYLNTIDPWTLRDTVVSRLYDLRDQGRIAPSIRIATEASCRPNMLQYNPLTRR